MLDVALVGGHLVGGDADGSAGLRVEHEPTRVCSYERVLASGIAGLADTEVAVGAQTLEARGPGAHGNLLAKARQPFDLDLPGAQQPREARFARVLRPHAHALGVEGAAVLQVVHERRDREDAPLVYLAEPDPAREGVHAPSPPRVCRSCRPPGPRGPLATEEIVPVGRLPSPGREGAAVPGVALAQAQACRTQVCKTNTSPIAHPCEKRMEINEVLAVCWGCQRPCGGEGSVAHGGAVRGRSLCRTKRGRPQAEPAGAPVVSRRVTAAATRARTRPCRAGSSSPSWR